MIELLVFVCVIILVVVAIKIGRQDNAPAARPYGLPDGLKMARQRAVKSGDTEAVQAIDNGTYKELLEHRAAARESKIAPGIEIYQYSIAGINYRKGIAAYLGRSTGYIKPEPTNRHDPNAIAVYADDGHHLGYIPATDTYEVHSLRLRFPIPVSVDIEECYDDNDLRFYVGEVTIKVQTKKEYENMKKILLFALTAIALTACKSDQQKMCEEYLRQNLKCPSTLKVVEYSETYMDESVDVDTTYHVRKIYGKMGWSSWKSISSIKVDSLRKTTITYPAHWDCNITYDAQNLLGATVRESLHLIVPSGYGYAMTWRNWFDFRYNLREVKTWHESHTYTDIPEKSYRVMYNDKWASLYELKK